MESLKEKTAKGLFWGSMNNGVQQIVGVVFGIILGRLLSQSDYGMMAMISVFSLVATALQDSGFRTALTNLHDPKDSDYNSVFWFNIIVGTLMYAVLFFCAPLIGRYYNAPDVVPLCRYAFLSIIIASLGTAQSAYLFKRLQAKQQAKAAMTAVLASSIVGSVMAWQGMAYWSLATQGLVYVSINTFMQWHYSPWRPSIRGITFEPVRRMFRFSFKILATTIMTHVNNNVLNLAWEHMQTRPVHYVVTIGQMARAFFESKHQSVDLEFTHAVASPTLHDARGIMRDILDLYDSNLMDEVYVIFTRMHSTSVHEPVMVKLLPIEEKDIEADINNTYGGQIDYDPSPKEVLNVLVPQYLVGMIYTALIHSSASEHASRMLAMSNATKNAEKILDTLSLEFNRLRQNAITTDLLDLSSGRFAAANKQTEGNART